MVLCVEIFVSYTMLMHDLDGRAQRACTCTQSGIQVFHTATGD